MNHRRSNLEHEIEQMSAPLPEALYYRLVELKDPNSLSDAELYLLAQVQNEESFPFEMVQQLISGANPIKVHRKHRGLTQKQFAVMVGINAVYFSQIGRDERNGSMKVLSSISQALDVNLDDLV